MGGTFSLWGLSFPARDFVSERFDRKPPLSSVRDGRDAIRWCGRARARRPSMSDYQGRDPMGSVIKKRRKRMAKKKHRKLLRKTRHQRRNKK